MQIGNLACRYQCGELAFTAVSRSGEAYMQPAREHAHDIIAVSGLVCMVFILSAWSSIHSVPGAWSSAH